MTYKHKPKRKEYIMSCTKKVTCSICNGEGRITVYKDPNWRGMQKIAKWFGDNYIPETEEIVCPTCKGTGYEKEEDHYWGPEQRNMSAVWRICKKCGKRDGWID